MIELLTADTPNGKKISIMLEEINFKYKTMEVVSGKRRSVCIMCAVLDNS